MDLQSYIELKKKYASMNTPQPVSEEVEVVEEELLDEALKGPDGKPLPVSAKEKNDAAYAEKARKFKEKNRGVTDYTAFTAGGGSAGVKNTGSLANNRTARDVQNAGARELKRQSDAKAAQKDREKKYGGNDLLTNLAGAGSKDAKAVKSKITKKTETPKTETPKTETPKTETPSNNSPNRPASTPSPRPTSTPRPAAPKRDNMASASKADRMAAFNKANPTIAKRNAEASRTRGTTSSSNPMMKGLATRTATPKPAATSTPKPTTPTKAPTTAPSSSSSSGGIKSSRLNKALSGVKKFGEEVELDSFDIILEYLTDSGFPEQEALVIMSEMSEEKREEILEAMKHREVDTGKVVDKAEVGKTYYPHGERQKSSVALRKEKEKKEMKEERSDTIKDRHLERGGHAVRSDYSKPADGSNTFGKKKSDPDSMRKAMEMVKKNMTDKYGKGAIMDTKKKKD